MRDFYTEYPQPEATAFPESPAHAVPGRLQIRIINPGPFRRGSSNAEIYGNARLFARLRDKVLEAAVVEAVTELTDDKVVPRGITGQELCAFLQADGLSELKPWKPNAQTEWREREESNRAFFSASGVGANIPSRRPLLWAVSPATAFPRDNASSRSKPRHSATIAAHSVNTGARLSKIRSCDMNGGATFSPSSPGISPTGPWRPPRSSLWPLRSSCAFLEKPRPLQWKVARR